MTHLLRFRIGILLVAMFTLLAGAVLSPSIATPRDEATVTPGVDDALYQDALPWDLAGDVEKMVVHRIVDGDTVQLIYPNGDWYYPTRIIGIQAPEMDGPFTKEGY